MAEYRHYAEIGADAGSAVKAFGDAAKSAEQFKSTLGGLEGELANVAQTTDAAAKPLQNTLGLYKELTTAVGGYSRAMKGLSTQDMAKGYVNVSTAIDGMKKALGEVAKEDEKGDSEGRVKRQRETLGLYKELTSSIKNYAQALEAQAKAIDNVAAAEQRQSGGGGPDGQTKMLAAAHADNEKFDRDRANMQMRATQEMEADFTKRAEMVQKEGNLQTRAAQEMETALGQKSAAQVAATGATQDGTDATAEAVAQGTIEGHGLAQTRYALYEVAAAYTAVATAAAALPVGGASAAIGMEEDFAHVARTTQAATAPLAALKSEFMGLSTEIPITFEELSRIGTLGAQMGIGTEALLEFTDTVAKFAATTDVSAESAAQSFGRMANMMELSDNDFKNLGSAVTEMGTNSVATEGEILKIAETIATAGNMAGFGTDEVVGLSTALASLRIRPQMARGAMQRIFAKLNAAVADGTEELGAYAKALGISEDAAAELWRNDPSKFFQGVAQSLSQMDDNVERSQFIREELNLKNVRDIEVISRLANGYEVYADSMNLAGDAYARGDYLDKEAAVIFETTAATLERLGAAFKNMLASFGSESLGPIRIVGEVLIKLLEYIEKTPTVVKNFVVAISSMIAIFAAVRAAMALAMASMLAFQMMMRHLGQSGKVSLVGLLGQASQTFPGISAHADRASASITNLQTKFSGLSGSMAASGAAATTWGTRIARVGIGGWVGILATLGSVVYGLVSQHKSAGDAAEAHGKQFMESMGGSQAVLEALRKDADEFADGTQTESFGELNVSFAETEGSAQTLTEVLDGELKPAVVDVDEAVGESSESFEDGALSIGAYTDAILRDGLLDALKKSELSVKEVNALLDEGFDMEKLMGMVNTNQLEEANEYLNEFIGLHGEIADAAENPLVGLDEMGDQYSEVGSAAEKLRDIVPGLNVDMTDLERDMLLAGIAGVDAFGDIEEGAEGAGEGIEETEEALSSLIDEIFSLVDTEAAVHSAMESLGDSLAESLSFDTLYDEGRANMDALRGVMTAVAEDLVAQVEAGTMSAAQAVDFYDMEMRGIIQGLQDMGIDTSAFEDFMDDAKNVLAEYLGIDIDVSAAIANLSALLQYAHQVFERIRAETGNVGMAASGARYTGKAIAAGVMSIPEPATYVSGGTKGSGGRGRSVGTARQEAVARKQSEKATKNTKKAQDNLNKASDKGTKSTKDTAEAAKKVGKNLKDSRTEAEKFDDYISRLGKSFDEVFDSQYGMQDARDAVESQLHAMRDAAKEAKEEVRSLREEARSLKQEASEERVTAMQSGIFAGVAKRYGDDTRETQYRTEAAGARANAKEKDRLARTATREANALDKNRLSLTGYSKEAIENRSQVRKLQKAMSNLIIEYAKTGASQKEITAFSEKLRQKFKQQVTQMGYNRRDVGRLSTVFKKLRTAIRRVPRNVRIKATASTANAQRKLKNLSKKRTVPIRFSTPSKTMSISGNLKVRDVIGSNLKVRGLSTGGSGGGGGGGAPYAFMSGGGRIPGVAPVNRSLDNLVARDDKGGMLAVQSGEYVVKTNAVDHYGLDFMHALNNMQLPPLTATVAAPRSGGNASSPGAMDLSPQTIHALAGAVSTRLEVDGKVIAGATNRQNTVAARRGAN